MSALRYVQIRRYEEYGDEMTFAFAENATIRQIKELMVKYYPYPININSIVMDDHGAVLKDDTLLFDIVRLWVLSNVQPCDVNNFNCFTFTDGQRYEDICPFEDYVPEEVPDTVKEVPGVAFHRFVCIWLVLHS